MPPPLPRPVVARAAAATAMVVAVCVSGAGAQSECEFLEGSTSFQSMTIPGQGQVFYLGTPTLRCADGVRIQADSAVAYQAQNVAHFLGRVRFRDPQRLLLADQARYFTRVGRLQAEGNLVLRDTVRGSVIENGEMVYLRQTPERAREQITVTTGVDRRRPKATLVMKAPLDTARAAASGDSVPAADTAARPAGPAGDTAQTPWVVEANRLFLEGDEYFLATGAVAMARDSLLTYSDSAEYDQVAGRLLLTGSARVEGSGFDLRGRAVDIGLPGGEVRTVRAVREAELVGEDLTLTAPVIHIFLEDGTMDRLVAVPLRPDPRVEEEPDPADAARPVAVARRFRLTADSVEVVAPGEILDRIVATGRARGESTARDSLNVEVLPPVAREDWLEGDTVVATFVRVEPLTPADTARREYELERLIARGSARTLYRLLPSDSTARPGVDAPAVHYVTGASIVIVLLDGEVDRMEVDGPTRGWHLEPLQRRARPDSVPPPDTSGVVPPDRGVRPDTVAVGGARPEGRRGQGTRPERTGDDAAPPGGAARRRGPRRRSRR